MQKISKRNSSDKGKKWPYFRKIYFQTSKNLWLDAGGKTAFWSFLGQFLTLIQTNQDGRGGGPKIEEKMGKKKKESMFDLKCKTKFQRSIGQTNRNHH